jgi:hypothetical protein
MRQILIKINVYGKKGHPGNTTEHTHKNRIYETKRDANKRSKTETHTANKK